MLHMEINMTNTFSYYENNNDLFLYGPFFEQKEAKLVVKIAVLR